MEIVIVICLLILIALLVQDKIVIKKSSERKPIQGKSNPKLPDIMGQPRPKRSLSVPNNATERQNEEQEVNPDNFDIEYDENENVDIQIPQEELDEVFSNMSDFDDEEDEWNRYGISSSDNGFAQGVTFEELSSVGMLLQKEKLEPSQKETAIAIVQKIQGTELFSLLENSMEGASQKIAELLDSTFSSETEAGSSTLRKNDLRDFDIGEFV
ncbi:conjugal transfer protein TraD [Flavobacterium petrolei]|uniref:Conjugal transfer protein TraD n=2 Tax=Flavobacterium TaxID=237 RepID=A0A482TN60_9FLAO|nr:MULTISPECIES: conjugal transfer protein TraD [Flavobacterium]MBP7500902.1 conjugal transfer protein TraD [Chryseobacterium sp.]RYJ51389.1 conjugal transfer protein TraD [Flavobacterium petrolei]UFH45471.1 conjugal transfer protein TraD [Flavobacterium sp. F-340]